MSTNILDQVISFLVGRGVPAYLVGGIVRDQLMGRTQVRDVDIAVQADASALARALADALHGALYLMDAEHNVARVILQDVYIDLAQLRGDLASDLSTRDFTINAMALAIGTSAADSLGVAAPTHLIDPYNGREDLARRRIRAVSDHVFQDDPVRLLRAIRLAGDLNLEIDPETQSLVVRNAALLTGASVERARDEFCKILALDNADRWLRQMHTSGLLRALLAEVAALEHVEQTEPHPVDALEHSFRVVAQLMRIEAEGYRAVGGARFSRELVDHFQQRISGGHTRGLLLRLAALLHRAGETGTLSTSDDGAAHFDDHETESARNVRQIMQRLRFSKDESGLLRTIVQNHLRPAQLAREPYLTDRATHRFFRDVGPTGLDICVLALADTLAKTESPGSEDRLARVRVAIEGLLERHFLAYHTVIAPPPLVDGRILMRELGIGPGQQLAQILEQVREEQAEGNVKTRQEALAFSRSWLLAHGPKES